MNHSEIVMYSRLFLAVVLLGVFVAMAAIGILLQRRRDRLASTRSAGRAATATMDGAADRAAASPTLQPRAWTGRTSTEAQPRHAA